MSNTTKRVKKGLPYLALLLLLFAANTLSGQCDLKRLWTITEIAPQLANYWTDVDRVDFNDQVAVFTRRDRNDCIIISCPRYEVLGNKLNIIYAGGDTLHLTIRERGCRILDAYGLEANAAEKQFVLIASPDDQCNYPLSTTGCRRLGGSISSVDTIPRTTPPQPPSYCDLCPTCPGCPTSTPPGPETEPETETETAPETGSETGNNSGNGPDDCIFCNLLDPASPIPVWLQIVFILFYVFYLLAFFILWILGRTTQRNYCWLFLCAITGLYSPFAYGPLLAFAVHLSAAVAYCLREFKPLNSIGKLFFYGLYSGLFVIYEMTIRFGLEMVSGADFAYLTPIPLLVFLIGIRLCAGVINDATRLGFGGLLFYAVMIGVLYFGPYMYICNSRAVIIEWVISWGVL